MSCAHMQERQSVKRESKSDATSAPPVPQLRDDLTEASVSTKSPVEAIDLETANAKLREDCHTFSFNAQGNRRGRVDVVRLSSNDPVEDFWDVAMGKGVGGNQTLYSGIYDGHAGWATAKILEKTLVPLVSIALSQLSPTASREAVEDTIKRTFLRLDKRIDDRALEAMETGYMSGAAEVIAAIAPAIAGSCALLTTFDVETSTLRTAVTGDSRAVRGAWSSDDKTYKADCLSHDQTGLNRHEVKRIDAEHPGEKEKILDSRTGRLLGLAVTRAFGDHRWKWTKQQIEKARDNFYGTAPRPDYETPPYMSAEPEITMRKIQTEDFVILASDGLWGRMNNDDAVACISRWLVAVKAGKPEPFQDTQRKDDDLELWRTNSEHFVIEDLDNAAVCLAKNALGGSRRKVFLGLMSTSAPTSRGARDDITIQVIFFKDPHQTS
ncbi:phosphatase 2C-like domain-containing protein [Mariannaea sp. PMI_226]|nr:phosphatase 2C-like domain-containing protein [Mariannaea sp. PMI_226]